MSSGEKVEKWKSVNLTVAQKVELIRKLGSSASGGIGLGFGLGVIQCMILVLFPLVLCSSLQVRSL